MKLKDATKLLQFLSLILIIKKPLKIKNFSLLLHGHVEIKIFV